MPEYTTIVDARAPDNCPRWITLLAGPLIDPAKIPELVGFKAELNPITGKIDLSSPFVGAPWWEALPRFAKFVIWGLCYLPLALFAWTMVFVLKLVGCINPFVVAPIVKLCVIGFANKLLGVRTIYAERTAEQQINSACPVEILSSSEANVCVLADTIPYTLWACYQNANGYREDVSADMVWAMRSRCSGREYIDVWKRGYIALDHYQQRMRESGYLDSVDRTQFEWSAEQWAPITDVLRFMVRDTADEAVVAKYGYDHYFTDKLKGEVKKMYDAQNMPDWIAKHYWRSHWQMVSPTQLYEMLHRQRPDRTDGGPVTTKDDVAEALSVNDYPDYWIPRLIDISYRPLTRMDTYRSFQIDVLTRDEVKSILMDTGYDERNAERLTKFYERLKFRWQLSQAGAPTASQIAYAYRDYTINQETARRELRNLQYSDEIISLTLLSMDEAARRNSTKQRVKGIRRKYTLGAEDWDWASRELASLSLDFTQIIDLKGQWDYARKHGERRPTVSQLCKAYKAGDLSWEDYIKRLERLNYSLDDALMVAEQCEDQRLIEQVRAEKKAEAERCKPRKRCPPPETPPPAPPPGTVVAPALA